MKKIESGKDCQTNGTREKGVSIIIPVFNEEWSIATTLEAIDEHLIKIAIPFELIVVNDGSTDSTSKILHDLQLRFQNLVIIEHEENLGYGAALKTGIVAGSFDKVLIIDADQTYPIQEIHQLIKLSEDFDMVVGSRVGAEVHNSFFRCRQNSS